MFRRWWALSLLVAACRFDAGLPPGVRSACEAESDCPSEHVCDRAVRRCVAAVQPFSRAPVVAPALAKEGTQVTLRFALAQGYGGPFSVCALSPSGDCFANLTQLADDPDGALAFSLVVGPEAPEGAVPLQLDARGGSTSYSGIALGSFTLDRTPPKASAARLSFEGSLTNPLVVQGVPQAVGALGPKAEALLTLELSEPLSALRVSAALPGGSLEFTLEEQGPRSARLRGRLPQPPPPGGRFPLDALLTDLAGNTAAVQLPLQLEVRSSPPPTLAVDTEGAVRFRRAARGTSEDPTPSFTLEGRPGAAPLPGGAVLAFNEAGVVGRAPVAADGSFGPVQLALLNDVASVRVQYLDAAGNPSALAQVRDVSWLAVDRRVSTQGTPMTTREVTDRQSALAASTADSEFRPVSLVRGGAPATARGGWLVLPVPSTAAGASSSGRPFAFPILGTWFGSRPGYGLVGGTTASVDGRTLVGTLGSACSGHAVCDESVAVTQDGFRRAVTFYGGKLGPVWLTSEVLTPASLLGPAGQPSPREYAALQWQGFANTSLLFGGVTATGPTDETWELAREAWVRRAPPQAPPARSRHALVEDSRRGRVLLFGGRGADGGALNDTWAWNGTTWAALDAGERLPSPREGAALAYDAVEDRVLLVGGDRGGGALLGDTWAFDGLAWAPLDAGALPPRRSAGLAQEQATGLVVLSGGVGGGADGGLQPLPDTWMLSAGQWAQVTNRLPSPNLPPAPDGGFQFVELRTMAKAWDPVRRVLVAHGGAKYTSESCGDCCSEEWAYPSSATWEFDGARWAMVPGGEVPGPLLGAAMAYDPLGARMLMAGGGRANPGGTPRAFGNGSGLTPSSDIFERKGSGPWVPLPSAPFSATRQAALAYEPSSGQVLLDRSGGLLTETWSLRGDQWTLLDGQAPRSFGHILVWSEALRRILRISSTGFEASWTTRWNPIGQPVRSGGTPPPMAGASPGDGFPMVVNRAGVQLLRGSSVVVEPIAFSNSSTIPGSGLLFFDPAREAYGISPEFSEGAWVEGEFVLQAAVRWLRRAPTRPAVALNISLGAAAPGRAEATEVRVRLWAAARGASGSSPDFGPEVHLLEPTGFRRRASVASPDSAAVEVAFTVDDRALLARLLDSSSGLSRSLALEVSPRADNFDGQAAVRLERAEVEFSWRLPTAADGGSP